MNHLNSFLLEGNLTEDVQLVQTSNGNLVAKFTLASNRWYKNSDKEIIEEVLFLGVEAWNSLAQGCSDFLAKGQNTKIIGRLKQDRWEDSDGKTYQKYILVAEHVDFKSSRKKGSE